MPKLNAKSKRGDAERAAEHYCHDQMKCVITRRAVRTKWQKQDFFGCDVIGKRADGVHVYVQVTAGQHSAVTARRRKLEDIPWHKTDIVHLLQLVQTEDPANARRKLWFFRLHMYVPDSCFCEDRYPLQDFLLGKKRVWKTEENAIPVPREWFKAYKNAQNHSSD